MPVLRRLLQGHSMMQQGSLFFLLGNGRFPDKGSSFSLGPGKQVIWHKTLANMTAWNVNKKEASKNWGCLLVCDRAPDPSATEATIKCHSGCKTEHVDSSTCQK